MDNYLDMLNNFRSTDLSLLLASFGKKKTGRKSELKDRALELLRSGSSENFNHQSYLRKICEIYHYLQIQPQKFYHQPKQYAQPMQMITEAGLPPAMPQMQRSMYENSFSANTTQGNSMANNNIQYSRHDYKMAGPHTVVFQLPSGQKINVGMTQQAFDMKATTGDNFYMPSAQTLTHITFKKLPFYDMYDTLIKPTVLNSKERCTLQNASQGMREATFKLNLSAEQSTMVSMNCDLTKNEYVYQYQIRICQLEPGCTEVTDFMPLGLYLRLNGKAIPLPPIAPNTCKGTITRRASCPINCTQLMNNAPIVQNEFAINWIPDQKNYAMGIYLVKKLTTETLIQKLIDKGAISSEETRNNIIKKLAELDPDLATTSYNYSLICPLGQKRMKIPAKSIHCDHLQCFDANEFLLMNDKKPTWMCPTCNQPCLYDDIVIQNYFLEVVTSPILTDDIQKIAILADGTWVVNDENNDTNQTTTTKVNLEIESVIVDSDDEEYVEL